MPRRFIAFSLVFIALFAAAPRSNAAAAAPTSHELHAKGGGRVWVYFPPGVFEGTKVACVLVPPAGSRMFHGMLLDDSDREEHYPYVKAGFAVVSFDISGPWVDTKTNAGLKKAMLGFKNADFGVKDGLDALQLALATYPQIDPKRLYVAGHSSAATLALQIAAASDQFRACAAYAPIADVAGRLNDSLGDFDQLVPGFSEALRRASPNNRVATIRCPVFLFHASDDGNVLPGSVRTFRDALVAQGKTVNYVLAKSGGHYQSMINEGLPQAIGWFKSLDERTPSR